MKNLVGQDKGKGITNQLPLLFPGTASTLHSQLFYLFPTGQHTGMRNGGLQSVITIPVCCFFLLLTLFCSSFGLLQAFQSFSVNLPQHKVSMGYNSFEMCLPGATARMSAAPWSLQSLQGSTCSTRTSPGSQGNLCLGQTMFGMEQSQCLLTKVTSAAPIPIFPLGTHTQYRDKQFSVSK